MHRAQNQQIFLVSIYHTAPTSSSQPCVCCAQDMFGGRCGPLRANTQPGRHKHCQWLPSSPPRTSACTRKQGTRPPPYRMRAPCSYLAFALRKLRCNFFGWEVGGFVVGTGESSYLLQSRDYKSCASVAQAPNRVNAKQQLHSNSSTPCLQP